MPTAAMALNTMWATRAGPSRPLRATAAPMIQAKADRLRTRAAAAVACDRVVTAPVARPEGAGGDDGHAERPDPEAEQPGDRHAVGVDVGAGDAGVDPPENRRSHDADDERQQGDAEPETGQRI